MFKYYNALINRAGDALVGYRARLFDQTGNPVALFGDAAGTPIIATSGEPDTAISDDNGMIRFYVNSGEYDLRLFDPNDVFFSAEKAIPMVDAVEVATAAAEAVVAGKADAEHGHEMNEVADLADTLAAIGEGLDAKQDALTIGAGLSITTVEGEGGDADQHVIAAEVTAAALAAGLAAKVNVAEVATQVANYALAAADAGKYIRIGTSSALDITIAVDATTAQPANGEWHFRATGDVEFVPASGVVIHAPHGGTLAMEAGMTVTLKRVAADIFDLLGQTVAA